MASILSPTLKLTHTSCSTAMRGLQQLPRVHTSTQTASLAVSLSSKTHSSNCFSPRRDLSGIPCHISEPPRHVRGRPGHVSCIMIGVGCRRRTYNNPLHAAANVQSTTQDLPLPNPPSGFELSPDGRSVSVAPTEHRLVTLLDPMTQRPLECVIRRRFRGGKGREYFLLYPLDTPILLFKVPANEEEGPLQEIGDDEVDSILPAATYALAKKSLHLVNSGFSLTLRGSICYGEEDVISLDDEFGLGIGSNLSEGVDIATFNCKGGTYLIYTPFDPLMFVAYEDPTSKSIVVVEDESSLNDPAVLEAIEEEQNFQAMVEAEDEVAEALMRGEVVDEEEEEEEEERREERGRRKKAGGELRR